MSGGVILTGAAGFIGEHLSQHLAARGIDHGAVFRVAPETATSHRTEHVGDLLDGSFTEDALSGYDTVVHLAGRTGGGQLESPEEFVRANVETTAAVQRAAKQAGVGRVIVASSYEAYGTPQQSPLDEDHPLEPASIYGVSMAAREMIARQLGEAYGIETILLRLFTVYG
ncbi:MAG: NAD(P)-dependent oxidoreductase, partial [Gemmatimonadetes bacterium]|nr:NAD(P)-dependent oxidoreductase [Gemmatimonadota bacterium]